MTESGWGQGRRPGLGWRRNGVTERRGWPGLTLPEERVKSKGTGVAGEARSSQEMPCSSSGPRHLALGSVRCQEGRCSLRPNLIRRKEAFSWLSL